MKRYLGIDIGGTKIKYGILDENGVEIEKNEVSTPRDTYEDFIKVIADVINSFENLDGVGMSIPGCVDPKTGYISNGGALRYLDKINLKDELKEYTDLELAFENDANCVGLAEKWIGNAKECTDFICITVGTGIGGALFVNNKLCSGRNNFSGEFGYMVVDDKKGLSTMSKVAATESLVVEVAKLKGIDYKELTGVQIFEMMKNNDTEVINIYKAWVRRLAIGIYNLGFIVDPQKILIGGGISSAPGFIDDIKKALRNIIGEIEDEIPPVVPSINERWELDTCKYFNNSGKIGAVYNLISK